MNDTRPDRMKGGARVVDDELNEQAKKQTAALGHSDTHFQSPAASEDLLRRLMAHHSVYSRAKTHFL